MVTKLELIPNYEQVDTKIKFDFKHGIGLAVCEIQGGNLTVSSFTIAGEEHIHNCNVSANQLWCKKLKNHFLARRLDKFKRLNNLNIKIQA